MTRGTPFIVTLWKENKTYKIGQVCKNLEYFTKTGYTNQKQFEENKTVTKTKL